MKKTKPIREIIFEVHEADEGGYWAEAIGHSIFTQADNWNELKNMIKDAVHCHFSRRMKIPHLIRLHFVRDEVFAA
ncbi:MAG: 2-oxoisovalerate dehydrogenase [Verrucomicrobiota bacterium]